jgi:NAD+ synthase
MKNLAVEISIWLEKYAIKNNRAAWVVGVSGGVDSALVSTLCALTGMPTHCVIMPCQSRPDSMELARSHVDWLTKKYGEDVVTYHKFDLTNTFEQFATACAGKYDNDLAYANTKSRLRMIVLYQIATCCDGLVVGTGNKVEDFGIGFFTKYGDGGVDISPIADIMKSEVRQMCRALKVLPELCEAIPTDGLWADNRTDEIAIGASYDELEWAMTFSERGGGSDIVRERLTERQKEVLKIYDKWHNAGAHKMVPIPTFKRILKY